MQNNVTAFPRQAALPKINHVEQRPTRHSGIFDEVPQSLPTAQLAAALVLAVHRGLVAEPERKRLPLR
jgi:hypothetical protein